jgi:hypothetical protein
VHLIVGDEIEIGIGMRLGSVSGSVSALEDGGGAASALEDLGRDRAGEYLLSYKWWLDLPWWGMVVAIEFVASVWNFCK